MRQLNCTRHELHRDFLELMRQLEARNAHLEYTIWKDRETKLKHYTRANVMPPVPAEQIADNLDMPRSYLQHRFPDEYHQLVKRYEDYIAQKHREECQPLEQIVTQSDDVPAQLPERLCHDRTYIEELLAAKLFPFPRMCDIARTLGYADAKPFYKAFPDLCKQVTERSRSDRDAIIRRRLENILVEDPDPFPSLKQVVQDLGYCDMHALKDRYPELCQRIVKRQKTQLAQKLEAALECMQSLLATPGAKIPGIKRIADQYGVSETALRQRDPQLCNIMVTTRRKQYTTSKAYRQEQLKTIIQQGANGATVPPLVEIAESLGVTGPALSNDLSDQCNQIKWFREQHKQEYIDYLGKRMKLFAEGANQPPLALAAVARQFGSSEATLYKYFPVESRAIVENYRMYRRKCHEERIAEQCAAIRAAVFQLYQESGKIPLITHVANHLGSLWTVREPYQKAAYKDAVEELQDHLVHEQAK